MCIENIIVPIKYCLRLNLRKNISTGIVSVFTNSDSLQTFKLWEIVEIDGILKNVETPEDYIS